MSSSLIKALINSTQTEETTVQPLTFTCTNPTTYGASISLKFNGTIDRNQIQYRTSENGPWLPIPDNNDITCNNVGDIVQFQNTAETLSTSTSNYLQITQASGSWKISGNICSMLNYKTELHSYCFYQLFSGCKFSDASELILPDNVASNCYYKTFNRCTNLTNPPKLPATILADSCYKEMFYECRSLISAPELPAMNLAASCYLGMFKYCSKLVNAPELPATTLAMSCYKEMFGSCSKLTTAPFLPASALLYDCYNSMFANCSSLNYIKVGFNELYLGSQCASWVYGVSATGTFASTSRFNTLKFGTDAIPVGWNIEGRNVIYVTNQNASLPIFENFEQNITYTALPATTKPAAFTIVEGELPETIKITSSKGFTGYAESEQSFTVKVKIEIDGYEPAYKTVNFNFYKEAKLADYKLYLPFNNIDTVSVNDGDANNPLSFAQQSSSYPVKFVEQKGRWDFENWKVAEISGGSGYNSATLVGKNVGYQKLPSGNNHWSISFTMKLKQYSTDTSKSVNVIQIGYGYSTGNHIRFGLMPYNSKAYLYLDTYNMDDANFSDEAKESRIIELDTWYNITVTYQDKTLNYYFNNELIATTTLANNLNVNTTSSSTYFNIGGYSNESGWRGSSTECYMKDLLIFNRVLTEAEVYTLYKLNVFDIPEDSFYLNASNFTEEDASYYNVSSLNGKYYLIDETLTGIKKVYKNEDNGIFIKFNKELNCWMFSSDATIDAGVVYTKSLDVISWPIERNGEPLQWVRSGIDIEGTVNAYFDIDFPDFDDILPPNWIPSVPANKAAFRVTGAGSTEANGDYYATGETRTKDGYGTFPVYKNNNNIYMYFSDICGYSWAPGWCLSPTIIDQGGGMLYCTAVYDASDYATAMLKSWSSLDGTHPSPTCYELDSNGNIILPVDYTVTGAGTAAVNGYYYATGDKQYGYPVYANKNGVKLWYFGMMGGWVFSPDFSEATASWYYHCEAYGDVTTGNWANDALYPTVDALGSAPLPTVTKGKVQTTFPETPTEPDEPDKSETSDSQVFTVTNSAFIGDLADYTGHYEQINAPVGGTAAIYQNQNGRYLKWWNATWGWSFCKELTDSYPEIITYETSDDPTNASNRSNWWNENTIQYITTGAIMVGRLPYEEDYLDKSDWSTCIWCGHQAPADAGWPLCPSCGKFQ